TNEGGDETAGEARRLDGASPRSRPTGDSTEVGFRASWVTWPLFPAFALACSICSKDVIIQGFPLDPAVDSTPRSGCSRAQTRIAANSAADWPLPSKTGVPFMYAV